MMKCIVHKAILFLLLRNILALTFTPTFWDFQSTFDKIRFNLLSDNANFILHIMTDEYHKEIVIPRAWLVPQEEDENRYVSSYNYDKTVTTFKIGDGRIGIHLSSYEIQKEGSAQAAAGRDVFLVYNSQNPSAAKPQFKINR